MIFHENESCPVCSKKFEQDDDVVVCPVCGTPHHRECYNSIGKCVNHSKHSQGYEYKPADKPQASAETAQRYNPNNTYYETAQNQPEASEVNSNAEIKSVCDGCGSEIEVSVPFCPYCGKKQENADYSSVSATANTNMKNKIKDTIGDKCDNIEGKSLSDVATVVKVNAVKYIPKFVSDKKISWNWGAFFFGPYFLFYRKMYKEGTLALLVRTGISLIIQSVFSAQTAKLNELMNMEMTNMASGKAMDSVTVLKSLYSAAPQLLLFTAIATFIINVVIALISNRLYRKKVISVLDRVDSSLENGGMFTQAMPFGGEQPQISQEDMKMMYLSRMGGVSLFAPVMASIALDLVLNVIGMLI